ncbi:Cuticle protein 7 [Frankliniella fusca]|uniref:Cuticle protein 7 n=1 Tax=Frankliniella fusca TaxID=407009 RepID=A0AAE1LSP6_9NEOP|nr:Cuticle protein 7 [Frankliniella fusca]
MKFLIVLCAALACAAAKPQLLAAPWAIHNGYAYSAAAPWASPLGHPIAQPLAYSAWAAPAAHHLAAAPLAYSAPAAVAAAPVAVAAPLATKSQYHAQDELGQASYGHSEPTQTHNAVQVSELSSSPSSAAGPTSSGERQPRPATLALTGFAVQLRERRSEESALFGISRQDADGARGCSTATVCVFQDAFGNKVGSFSYTAPDGRVLRTDYVADALGYRVSSNALPVAAAGLPLPVQDTPEVAIAKAQHLAAHGLHRIAKRSVALLQTPASTAPLATAIAAPVAYAAAPAIAHTYAAPAIAHTYAAPAVAHTYAAAPLAYSAHHIAAPVAYSTAHVAAPAVAYSAAPAVAAVHAGPVLREAVQTTVVNTPGHAVSYRVD